jgi:hypothetical protein
MSQDARDPHAPPPPPEDTVNPEVRFEHQDVEPGKIARYAIALGLVSVVTAAVSIWLLVALRRHEESGDARRPALYFGGEEQRQPEGVRLQNAPFQDLAVLREREAQFLHGYGWVDRSAGVVHIPIEQAMHLYLERQARAAPSPAASPAAAEGVPTDSAPVPSPRALAATPLPPPPPSPSASGTPAPPPAHGPGPGGGRQ